MAANYWASSQYQKWLFTHTQITTLTKELAEKQYLKSDHTHPPLDWRLANMWISYREGVIQLGTKILAHALKQQVMATARVYLRRFYLKQYVGINNPYLVIAAAIYLASKMEECPLQIRQVVQESKSLWPDCNADTTRIGELEFTIIETLESQLIIHHPYESLHDLRSTLNLTKDDIAVMECIINDHYHTDLPLLYPPSTIAVATIVLALTMHTIWTKKPPREPSEYHELFLASYERKGPNDGPGKLKHLATWIANTELSMEDIAGCIQLLIEFYQTSSEEYNDQKCKTMIFQVVNACN